MICALLGATLLPSLAVASPGNTWFSGIITDAAGATVPGAHIYLYAMPTPTVENALTPGEADPVQLLESTTATFCSHRQTARQ